MNRRTFLGQASCGAVASLLLPRAWSQNASAATATVSIGPLAEARRIPDSFTGLSYELAQLTEPGFFSERNTRLVALFRRLSPGGLLRLGGNTSEFCWFQADASTPAPKLHVPAGNLAANWMPHRLFPISPRAIDTLAGFLKATGWKAIYGVNFGNSTPDRAAVEAAYVAEKLGPGLAFFQIGNEPDFYRDPNNGTRPPGWDFADYVAEWVPFADAITRRVPQARFGGPDVGSSSDWVTRFGEEVAPKLGRRLVALTGHYYAEGPPDDPRVTTARLLAGNPGVTTSTNAIVRAAGAHGLTYHMTEGNSCYRGGKPGMSNAFAAALWAGDYMLLLASLGCAGVNLHGGSSRVLSAGLGNHNPGLAAAIGPQAAPNGFYTPIASEEGQAPVPRPVFYGMLLAQQLAGATVLRAELKAHANVTAYAGRSGAVTKLALFNKGAAPVSFLVQDDRESKSASLYRLQAPALDATTGVTLGGAEIAADGSWRPRAESLPISNGRLRLTLPAASAALVVLG